MVAAQNNSWVLSHGRVTLLGLPIVVCLVLAMCSAYQHRRSDCVSREAGLRGEMKRGGDGQFLYFNGACWTRQPLPPTDTPF